MQGNQLIKVLVSQHDPVVQAGLSTALGRYADLQVVAAAARSMSNAGIDVVIADYDRGMDFLNHAAVGSDKTVVRVLIIATDGRASEVSKALRGGVRGYALAGRSLDSLADAIRVVHGGGIHLDPEIAQRLAQSLYSESLTSREAEVLGHVVDGRCNKEIAGLMDVALGTVKSHLRAIYGKLEVSSRTQAVAAVAKRGLLQHDLRNSPSDDPRSARAALREAPGREVAGHRIGSTPMPLESSSLGHRRGGEWSPELALLWTARQRDAEDVA